MSTSASALRRSALAAVTGLALAAAGCGASKSTSSSSSHASTASPAAPSATTAGATGVALGSAHGSAGTYLTASGRALYLWVADTSGRSHCSGACAKAWPPLTTTGHPVATGQVRAAALGTITRSDGTHQVTYNGHPLYFFVADQHPGTTSGQGNNGFGAKWWLVAPSGAAITTPGGSANSASSTTSSGGPAY